MMIRLISPVNLKRFVVVGVFGLALVALATYTPEAQAADPEIFITWKADTYVPPFYVGKSLPTTDSKINASLLIIKDGKLLDLSRETIYWYLNDTYIAGGVGMSRTAFQVPGIAPNTLSLTVKVPDYQNGLYGGTDIPVVKPETVLSSQKSKNVLSREESFRIVGYPFFFNVTKPAFLQFNWLANKTAPATNEDPYGLTLKFTPDSTIGSTILTSLKISNPLGKLEEASAALLFTLQ